MTFQWINITYSLFGFCIALLIAACGGASKSNQEPLKVATQLVAIAGPDQIVNEQTTVYLKGSATGLSNATATYNWKQISGNTIFLEKSDTSNAFFLAPDITSNETITLELSIETTNNTKAFDLIDIEMRYLNTAPTVNAGDDIAAYSFDNVILSGNIYDAESDFSSVWLQKDGIAVDFTVLANNNISFKLPSVEKIERLVFELKATDDDNLSSSDYVEVKILPPSPNIPKHALFLTNERIEKVKLKIAEDSSTWNILKEKIANYFEKIPYNAGEYAGSFALAYYISGDRKYIERAIELINHAYFKEPTIGWEYYNSRNLFRVNARWATMGYSWIQDFITSDEKQRIENILQLWGEYWLNHVDYQNNFAKLAITDTDEVTSLAENITLLGYALSSSNRHKALSEQLLNAGDILLNRYVVDYYMKDIMAGGAWAEGADYSPNTQRHWIRIFMINKDQRNIAYPFNYAHDAMQALLHQTLANYSALYKYGSEEAATDYELLSEDYRYEFALELMGILDNEEDLAQLYQWFNTYLAQEGIKKGSMETYFQLLINHDPRFVSQLPKFPKNTLQYSPGIGLVSTRNSWNSDASNLFFINRSIRVDHEHKDALSFDIAYKGHWITKEATGYAGISTHSIAHNTILIDNADGGSSSPTHRPAGKPKYYSIVEDENITSISADATQTYNMKGYFSTDYAKQVNRQVAFLKPNMVVVYDHIVTDKKQIRDLIQYADYGLEEGMTHTRWVKLIQHVQHEPTFISPSIINVKTENTELVLQVAYPNSVQIKAIDEKLLWIGESAYNLSSSQKKWHLEISNIEPIENNEFVTILDFNAKLADETVENVTPTKYVIMDAANSFITQGNIIGIALQTDKKKFILLFNRNPEITIEYYSINRPQGYETAEVYKIGFTKE